MNSSRHIISVSRRTDIPAFYTEWFLRRLKDGFAYYKNPFTGKLIHVSLLPEHIAGFVLWSKNFAPMLPYLEQIEQYNNRFFFHFTITGLSKEIELYVPPHDD